MGMVAGTGDGTDRVGCMGELRGGFPCGQTDHAGGGQQELGHMYRADERRAQEEQQQVSSRLGCLRKQAGLSFLPEPPLLPIPAAHV